MRTTFTIEHPRIRIRILKQREIHEAERATRGVKAYANSTAERIDRNKEKDKEIEILKSKLGEVLEQCERACDELAQLDKKISNLQESHDEYMSRLENFMDKQHIRTKKTNDVKKEQLQLNPDQDALSN